jgi:hypothetical protein
LMHLSPTNVRLYSDLCTCIVCLYLDVCGCMQTYLLVLDGVFRPCVLVYLYLMVAFAID